MHAPARRLSPRFAALVRESWWLLVVAAFIYLALILATYQRTDPGWSFSGSGDAVHNHGGIVGAWLADLLLYVFGVSAWWWVVGGVVLVVTGYRISRAPISSVIIVWLAVPGFAARAAVQRGARSVAPVPPAIHAARRRRRRARRDRRPRARRARWDSTARRCC